jgi:hypothetical protein
MPRHLKGMFHIQLTEREGGATQDVVVGIDPGSKKEAFTVKSEKRTLINIQADAVTHVKDAIETRRVMRRQRRNRKTPCRQQRPNCARGGLPPSTRARWQWKLRICRWLAKLYPIACFVVEDIAAITKPDQRRWNVNFSPLTVGKEWFYTELEKLATVELVAGYETKALRDEAGLLKIKHKLSDDFHAHGVDSFVLASAYFGCVPQPDNKRMLYLTPLRFHRRQLHAMVPATGGVRRPYGGTLSEGMKRGSIVSHAKFGWCYVGGASLGRVSLHSQETGQRLTQNAKKEDCRVLTSCSWRFRKGI